MKLSIRTLAALGAAALMAAVAPGRVPESVVNPSRLLDRAIQANVTKAAPNEDGSVLLSSLGARERLALLRSNYIPLVEGSDSIRGRPAWVLRLKPKMKPRPWRQLWVDKRDFTVLAMREWSHRNEIRRSLIIDRACSDPPAPNRGTVTGAKTASRTIMVPSYLPSGFTLADVRFLPAEGSTQVVYSDGMFCLSVFCGAGRAHGQDGIAGVYACGRGNAVAAHYGATRVLIIGDLPPEELLKMARSLKPNALSKLLKHL